MHSQARADTHPEVAVRAALFRRGLRFRKQLPVPGMPRRTIDIAFTRARVAVFVDGCFWHGCPDHGVAPKNNAAWWADKLALNQLRDRNTDDHLERLGWLVIRVWEHQDAGEVADAVAEAVRRIAERGVSPRPTPC